MKKVLPINADPYLRAYANHAYQQAIISSDDKIFRNEPAAVLYFPEINTQNWVDKPDQLTQKIFPDGRIEFYGNKWNQRMNTVFYRKIETEDKIEVTIEKTLFSHPYANIKVFASKMTTEDFVNCEDPDNHDYGDCVVHFAKDGICSMDSNLISIPLQKEIIFPIVIGLELKGNKLFAIFKDKNSDKREIELKSFRSDEMPNTIGLSIGLASNVYFEYLFGNYINIYYNNNAYGKAVALDFLTAPFKNYKNYTYNYFIDTNFFEESEIKKYETSILDFIRKQINMNRYVHYDINDNINFGVDDSNGKIFHQNLFYGYDDDKRIFYNLYFDHGKIKSGNISYVDFNSERNSPGEFNRDREIHCFKYNPGYEAFLLTPQKLIQQYSEFLESKNISWASPAFDTPNYSFGLNCLKKLMDDNEIEKTIKDIRISHFLYEHATCNADRAEFFYEKKLINQEERDKLSEIGKKDKTLCLVLRNSIIKMRQKKDIDYKKLKSYISQIYSAKKEYSELVISLLKAKVI